MPLLAVAGLASLGVAVGSYWIGDRWAREQAIGRFQATASLLTPASFPMRGQVVRYVATLTETELIVFNAEGEVTQSSMDLNSPADLSSLAASTSELRPVVIQGQEFQYQTFARRSSSEEEDLRVAVLFDESDLRATRLRAAMLPLVTGLSTIVLLTSVTLFLTTRLLRRIARLRTQVDQIAEGDFHVSVAADTSDELGMLGRAVERMGEQLQSLWQTLQRQQGQKLLHQVAGGLAHQLRNSITGARMAVELHQKECATDDDSLHVALSQLEQTEAQVRRLLLVASGKQEQNQPQLMGECMNQIRTTVDATAKHLRVKLTWDLDPNLAGRHVADGPTLHAAVTNLAINALEEATDVQIRAQQCDSNQALIEVIDNGKGPPTAVADEIFEPFVTSKPEGLGLGLPLVMRAAQRLGGKVEWGRQDKQTHFTLSFPLSGDPDSVATPSQV